MKHFTILSAALGLAMSLSAMAADVNSLTEKEKAEGWKLLWNGKTTEGWRSVKNSQFPAKGWEIKDGVLSVIGGKQGGGGDIITKDYFTNFELTAEFKITQGANSGIKYFIQSELDPAQPGGPKRTPESVGHEFQVLDDVNHPDAKLGHDGDRTVGSLYDLIPAAKDKKVNPIGEWNTMRIVVHPDNHVEHWLNGQKVVDYVRGSADFKKRVAASKYKSIPGFGEWGSGHILIQDHGNTVSYRNIKIRPQ